MNKENKILSIICDSEIKNETSLIYLIQHGEGINEKNKNGTIPFLHLLICMKLVQVERKTLIKYLVEQGANKKKF